MTTQVSGPDPARPSSAPIRGSFSISDCCAAMVLVVLTAVVAWNRLTFDSWLTRYDVYTQFLPWYDHLGERLRVFDVPGWNPHSFSGTPFAGHPLSGWMYLPAMVIFALAPVVAGFKVMVVVHLLIVGVSTYAYGRVLGMGAFASLVAAVVFIFGPFLEWNTYTSLQFALLGAWIPALLLGIELALQRDHWKDRIVPWGLAAFALSQMFAGWVGEGWIYAVLLVSAYTGYRAFLSPPRSGRGGRERLVSGATTGAVTGLLGAGLAAAGVLPRLAANAQTNLAGGDYDELGAQGTLNVPWELDYLLVQVMGMGTEYHHRAAGLGGAVVLLTLLAPILARFRFAVPFFAVWTAVFLILTLEPTPIHDLFYLIPQYQELHEHDPWRVVAMATFGPAMMAGATIESLGRWRGRHRILPFVPVPLAVMTIVAMRLDLIDGMTGWPSMAAAIAVTLAVLLVIAVPTAWATHRLVGWIPGFGLALILVAVFMQPTGLELTGSWLGWPEDERWADAWNPDPGEERALAIEVQHEDPGGAGEYLQNRLAEDGPFRYLGYGGVGHPDGGEQARSYMDRRFDPNVQAILVNGRPMFLDLYQIQGYDPVQLERYVDFVTAINGKPQDYHTAFVSDEGVDSPLLDLLNVQYVLVDATLPPDRGDIGRLTAEHEEVFRNDHVIVYENVAALPHAWIVHDVREVERGDALPMLVDGSVDPYQTALVEGSAPDIEVADDPAADRAEMIRYEPDTIEIETRTDAPGFLVVSEVYADGWRAYLDGERVDILPTYHALRGVAVPTGEHTVEMRYEPIALRAGLGITAGSSVLIVSAFAVAAWRRGWEVPVRRLPWTAR